MKEALGGEGKDIWTLQTAGSFGSLEVGQTNKQDGKTWLPVSRGSVVVQGLLWQYIQGKGHGSVALVLALVLRCCISGVLPKLASEMFVGVHQ